MAEQSTGDSRSYPIVKRLLISFAAFPLKKNVIFFVMVILLDELKDLNFDSKCDWYRTQFYSSHVLYGTVRINLVCFTFLNHLLVIYHPFSYEMDQSIIFVPNVTYRALRQFLLAFTVFLR